MNPKVSVICLCYNHAKFLEEAVLSVYHQTYKNVELIIVDDASKDNSRNVINNILQKYPDTKYIQNDVNLGMCKSFNKALLISEGEYVIDLAADDLMLPERIEKQIAAFLNLDENYGVVFTDAMMVNENRENLHTFYKRGMDGRLLEAVADGNIFTQIVSRYYVCSPTIMMKKKVLEELGGYDGSLSYEDYDFFIRSSRIYKYYFLDEILTIKRDVKGSGSYSFYKRKKNDHLESTFKVHKKYLWLCKNKEEMNAGLSSIRYHMRQSLFMECYSLCIEYFYLLKGLNKNSMVDKIIYSMAKARLPLFKLYHLYQKWV